VCGVVVQREIVVRYACDLMRVEGAEEVDVARGGAESAGEGDVVQVVGYLGRGVSRHD